MVLEEYLDQLIQSLWSQVRLLSLIRIDTHFIQRYECLNKYTKISIQEFKSDPEEKEKLLNILNAAILKLKPQNKANSIDSFAAKQAIPLISRLKPKPKFNGIPKPQRATTAKFRPNMEKIKQRSRPTTVNSKSTRMRNKLGSMGSFNMNTNNFTENPIIITQVVKNYSSRDLG